MSEPKHLSWGLAPFKELTRLAWPICISMLSYSAMTVADTAFVGALGPAALAGVGLAGILAFSAVVFGIGLLRGVKVVVSQAVGAGKIERVDALAAAGLLIALSMGAVVLVLGQLLVLCVPALAASEQAGVYGVEYLSVRLLAAPALYIFCTTRETSYGMGDSRSPMIASPRWKSARGPRRSSSRPPTSSRRTRRVRGPGRVSGHRPRSLQRSLRSPLRGSTRSFACRPACRR